MWAAVGQGDGWSLGAPPALCPACLLLAAGHGARPIISALLKPCRGHLASWAPTLVQVLVDDAKFPVLAGKDVSCLPLSVGPGLFELHQMFREPVFPVGVVKPRFGKEVRLLVLCRRGKRRCGSGEAGSPGTVLLGRPLD